jgi:hypothetical protein
MAVGGLGGMASALEEQPVTLAAEADLLEAALQEAPWIERGGEGPVIWAVAPLRCQRCAPFFERDLPALRAQGLRVRLILIAPRSGAVQPEPAGAPKVVRIRHGGPPMFAAAQDPIGASARDEDWARASLDRITAILAANGASMEMPCLIWRRGFEWRAAFARPGRSADYALQELAPEA